MLSLTVSDNLRQIFVFILIVGNFFSLNCGVIFMLLSWYVKTALDKKIHFLQEYYHPKAIPLSLLVSGLVMILVSFLGIKAAVGGHVVEDASDAKSAAFFFHLYWIAATITVFAIFAVAFACFVEIYLLRHALGKGLKAGMEKYGQSSEIKSEIDRLQIDYKCCGVDSYKTWYNISWIDVQFLDTRDPGVARNMRGNLYFGKDVPFSCCRMDVFRPCVDKRIEDSSYHSKYIYPSDLTLYTEGCLETITNYLGHTVFFGVGGFAIACFLIWITMTIISRSLYRSLA